MLLDIWFTGRATLDALRLWHTDDLVTIEIQAASIQHQGEAPSQIRDGLRETRQLIISENSWYADNFIFDNKSRMRSAAKSVMWAFASLALMLRTDLNWTIAIYTQLSFMAALYIIRNKARASHETSQAGCHWIVQLSYWCSARMSVWKGLPASQNCHSCSSSP